MASDAVLLEQVGSVILGQAERVLVKFAPIPAGRSYVISAKGNILASNCRATLTLEAFGAKDSVQLGFLDKSGQASFSLVVGVSLPPDDDLFVEAKVSGSSMPVIESGPASVPNIQHIKLVVLPVDSVTVSQVQT